MANETWYRVARHGATIDEVTVVRKTATSIWILRCDGRMERETITTIMVTFYPDRAKAIDAMRRFAENNKRTAENNLHRANTQLQKALEYKQQYEQQAQPA